MREVKLNLNAIRLNALKTIEDLRSDLMSSASEVGDLTTALDASGKALHPMYPAEEPPTRRVGVPGRNAAAYPAQKRGRRSTRYLADFQVVAICTTTLPKLRPSIMSRNACGAFSSPTVTSSRCLIFPSRKSVPTSRRNASKYCSVNS